MFVGEFRNGYGFVGNIKLSGSEGGGSGGVFFRGGEGESGDNGVGVVVLLEVVAEEVGTLDVEEGAM